MTGLQDFHKKMLFGEEASNHERSIRLVDIMKAFFYGNPEAPSFYIDTLKQINIKLS
jgi:hypothetical protein